MHINTLRKFDFWDNGLEHKTQYQFINQQDSLEKLRIKKLDLLLLRKMPTVKDITIWRTLLNEELFAEKFPHAKKLRLHGNSRRKDFSFIQSLPEIESITINFNSYLTTFPQIKHPGKVKYIEMLECPNFSDIDSLLPFSNLKELCLTSHNKPLQVRAEDFVKLKQLKELRRVYTAWGRKEPELVEAAYNETGWLNTMGFSIG